MGKIKQTYFSKKELIQLQESCIDYAVSEAKRTNKFKTPEYYLRNAVESEFNKGLFDNLELNQSKTGYVLRLRSGIWIDPEMIIVSKSYRKKYEKYYKHFGTKQDLSGTQNKFQTFEEAIEHDLKTGVKHNKRTVEKLANAHGITNKNFIKELTEYVIVRIAREYADKGKDEYESYQNIVELYKNQVNLSHRTSQSMLLQQYSTPAPVAYLASLYVKSRNRNAQYFEPSAGNGLLTLALPEAYTIVNEIDDIRLQNLRKQNFEFVSNRDATNPFTDYYKSFDGVITNPPFGTLSEAVNYDGYKIKTLDHLMALRALDTMKDKGKAAIIIGGHTAWDDKGRIQAGKNRLFFNYLYSHYYVDDVILLDGHKIYSKQGTSFDVRLILIAGRKQKTEGYAPLKNEFHSTIVTDFDDLWQRVYNGSVETDRQAVSDNKRIRTIKTKSQAKLKLLKVQAI